MVVWVLLAAKLELVVEKIKRHKAECGKKLAYKREEIEQLFNCRLTIAQLLLEVGK